MAGVTKDGGGGIGPHEIYVKITGGPGTDTLEAARDATQLEAQAEAERTTLISDLSKMIGDGWEGPASEAAYGVTKPLIDTGQQRTEHLGDAYDSLQDQLAAFADVKNKVRPVSATPPPPNVLVEAEPWLGDLDHTTQAYQNDSQNNIAAFSSYDSASQTNGGSLPREYPAFKDPTSSPDAAPSGNEQQSKDTSASGTGTSHPHARTGVPSVPSVSAGTHTTGNPVPHPGGQSITQAPQVPTGSTSASSATPPPIYQPGNGGGYPQAPAAQGPVSDQFGPYAGAGTGTGYGYGTGYGPGPSAGYGGGSAPGTEGRGASGPGGQGRAPETGARSGAGTLPPEEALARRPSAMGTTRGGMPGMGPMGAGAGKEEDAEHERPSFLHEDDPDDLFGTDEVTAPPVIE